MINICVPVLKRYDLLHELLLSLQRSTVVPECVYVINNGRDVARLNVALGAAPCKFHVVLPKVPMGIAESWNWFIKNVPEERLITNDDITFGPDSFSMMLREAACFVSCTFGFSCFVLRDECVSRVGLFDETISPGYAYFEDRDYYNRMKIEGIADAVVDCGVKHGHSQTLVACNQQELQEHNKKFVIAQENFLRKWGVLPVDLQRQKA